MRARERALTSARNMKIDRSLIFQLAGVSMIVGALFVAARAIGGMITIIYFMAATDFSRADKTISDTIQGSLMATQVPAAISGIASFLILFFGGRWMIKGPRMIERWIREGHIHEMAPSSDNSRISEQDGDGNPH